jgi:hypothetical protein
MTLRAVRVAMLVLLAAPAGAAASPVRASDAVPTARDLAGATVTSLPAKAWLARLPASARKGATAAGARLSLSTVTVDGFAAVLPSVSAAKRAEKALAPGVVWREGVVVGEVASVNGDAALLAAIAAGIRARVKGVAAETGWQRLQTQLATAGAKPSRSLVRRAFALAVAPLPGVKVSRAGVGRIESGTGPLALVLADLGSLNRRQRAVLKRILHGRPRARTSDLPNGGVLRGMARDAVKYFAGRLKLTPAFTLDIGPHVFGQPHDPSDRPDADKRSANGYSWGTDGTATAEGQRGPQKVCHIRLSPLLEVRGAEVEEVVAHEVFHCYQRQIVNAGRAFGSALIDSPWLIEGGAEWAQCTYRIGSNGRSWFAIYAGSPQTPLFRRSYDAIGFFSQIQWATGLDPYTTMIAALRSPGPIASARAILGGTDEPFFARLAPSFLQQYERPAVGEWDMRGECKVGDPPAPEPLVLGPDDSQAFAQETLNARLLAPMPKPGADLWTVTAGPGRTRVSGSGPGGPVDELLREGSPPRTYCLRSGSCACPGATTPAPPVIDPAAATKPVIAVTGEIGGGGMVVSTRKLVCPSIDMAQFTVGGAKFVTAESGRSWDATLGWDITWDKASNTAPVPLVAGMSRRAAAANMKNSGSFTFTNNTGEQCAGSLTITGSTGPKDAFVRVLDDTGAGKERTWTILVRATDYGVWFQDPPTDCMSPDFGAHNPDTLWQATVKLKATGSEAVHSETFDVVSDPGHAGYENWSGKVTLTGVW